MVEEKTSLWADFIETGEISERVDPIIKDSWKRCREYDVNPVQVTEVDVLTQSGLREKASGNTFIIGPISGPNVSKRDKRMGNFYSWAC